MTTTRNIDGGVNRAIERYVASLNGPDHRAAAEHLDNELERLTNAADEGAEPDYLMDFLCDWASGTGLLIRHVAPNPDTWMHGMEEIPVLEIANGETVWDALRRAYRENLARGVPAPAPLADSPSPSRGPQEQING